MEEPDLMERLQAIVDNNKRDYNVIGTAAVTIYTTVKAFNKEEAMAIAKNNRTGLDWTINLDIDEVTDIVDARPA